MSVARTPQAQLRAAIYVRVSSAQQEEDGTSLATQEARCRKYAADHGYTVDEAHVYREVHTGAELWERCVLQHLREAIRRRDVDAAIAYAIDRLSRDPVHLGVLISEAEHAGATVEFVSEPLDNTPEGQLIRFVRGYAAKVEHEKIKERTIRGRRARLEAGKPLVGPRPRYGYRWRDEIKSALEADPATAPIVERIFREAAAGKTLRRIAADLTADAIPRPRPTATAAWRQSTVHQILKEPIYAGRLVGWRYEVVRDRARGIRTSRIRPPEQHVELPADVAPPLVDAAAFEAVQVRLSLNQERATRNNWHPESSLLRGGYARCGYCGASMAAHQNGPNRRYMIYECHRAKASRQICPGVTISVPVLDQAAWARAEALMKNPAIIAAELERLRGDDPTAADLDAVDQRLAGVARQQRNLVEQLANVGGSVAELVTEKLATLERQREQLAGERDAILARRRAWDLAQARLGDLEAWCRSVATKVDALTYEQKRLALDALGVEARVWRPDHTPRYAVTVALPLEPAPADSDGDHSPIVSRTARGRGGRRGRRGRGARRGCLARPADRDRGPGSDQPGGSC